MKAVNEEVLSELEPTQTIVRLGLAHDEGLEAESQRNVELCAIEGATTLVVVGDRSYDWSSGGRCVGDP